MKNIWSIKAWGLGFVSILLWFTTALSFLKLWVCFIAYNILLPFDEKMLKASSGFVLGKSCSKERRKSSALLVKLSYKIVNSSILSVEQISLRPGGGWCWSPRWRSGSSGRSWRRSSCWNYSEAGTIWRWAPLQWDNGLEYLQLSLYLISIYDGYLPNKLMTVARDLHDFMFSWRRY